MQRRNVRGISSSAVHGDILSNITTRENARRNYFLITVVARATQTAAIVECV
jgi:hypothetical protein